MSELKNELEHIISKYESATLNLFKWRFESTMAHKIVLALGFACLTGLMAQFRFYLPFTPVPVTGQVFAALLAGVLLGKWYGGLSQGLYAGIGAAGVPWFTGMTAGVGILTGVTGGYIVGFIVAAMIIGWFTDRYVSARSFKGMFVLMIIGVAVIYAFGVVQLSIVLGVGAQKAIELGALPFIGADIYKALIAAAIAAAVTPKSAYGNELDSK